MKFLKHFSRKNRIKKYRLKLIFKNFPFLVFLCLPFQGKTQDYFKGINFIKPKDILYENRNFIGLDQSVLVHKLVDFDGDGDYDIIGRGIFYTYCSVATTGNSDGYLFYFIENIGTPQLPFFKLEYDSYLNLAKEPDYFKNSNLKKIKEVRSYVPLCSQTEEENQWIEDNKTIGYFDFADLDNDSDLDLATLSQDSLYLPFKVRFYKNIGNKFQPIYDTIPAYTIILPEDSYFSYIDFQFAEIDGDNNEDIVLGFGTIGDYYPQTNVVFFKNKSTETEIEFSEVQYKEAEIPFSNIFYPRGFEYIDLDKNGFDDLVIAMPSGYDSLDYNGLQVEVFLNDTNNINFKESAEIGPKLFYVRGDVLSSIPKINLVDIDNDGDLDISNLEAVYSYSPQVSSPNNYINFLINNNKASFASGEIRYDLNNDGIFNNDEQLVMEKSFQRVKISSNDYFTFSDENQYNLELGEGINIIKPSLDGFTFVPPNYTFVIPTDTSITVDTLDFNAIFDTNKIDLLINITQTGQTRAGFETNHSIYFNSNDLGERGAKIAYQPDQKLTVLNTNPPYDAFDGTTYFWDFNSVLFYNPYYINIRLKVEPTAPLGEQLFSNVSIQREVGTEVNLVNNFDTIKQTITGSYDPNDKLVVPEPIQNGITLPTDKSFVYTIRFQNTGNDTAFNIVVLDTIDTDFDITSFELIATSHPCDVSVDKNRVVKFFLQDVLLPDSIVNEEKSHGYIKYSIKPKENVIGTEFTNTANIYFDFNKPIITNETRNIFGVISGIQLHDNQPEINVKANPNPVHDKLLVEINNLKNEEMIFRVYDLNGTEMFSKMINSNFFHFSTIDLAPALYLYTIESANGFGKGKFVKE
jgi:hypothetical protein